MDSAVALNIKKRDVFKLQQHFMDTLYFFHSANSLTLNTVQLCIKNRLSPEFIGDNKMYYKSDIGNRQ